MKKIGKFFACFLPLIGMLTINVIVTAIAMSVKATSYIKNSGITDPTEILNYNLSLALDKDFLLTSTIIFQISLIIIGGLVYFFAFKEKKVGNPVQIIGGAGFGTIVLLFIGLEVLTGCALFGAQYAFPHVMEQYAELMEQSGLGDLSVLSTIATLVMAPIGEEIVFRGMTFKLARKFSLNFWVANIIQAVMFGVAHLNLVQGVYAFCLGLFLGLVYRKFNSLWATMLAHLTFNFCGTYLVGPLFGEEDSIVRIIILLVIALALVVGMIIALSKEKHVLSQETAFFERYNLEYAPANAGVQAVVSDVPSQNWGTITEEDKQ